MGSRHRSEGGVDAGHVGLHGRGDIGIQERKLCIGDPAKAEGAGEPIDWQRGASDELGECSPAGAGDELELERTILAVAEAEGEPGVAVRRRGDVRDSPAIPVDDDLRAEAVEAHEPAGLREAPAEEAQQRSKAGALGHRPHDATVYSGA